MPMLVTKSNATFSGANATFSGDLLELITSTPTSPAHTISVVIQKTSDGWEPLQANLAELIKQLIPSYLFLFIAGLICSLLTVALLYVLIVSPRMRKESRFVIFLAFGDLSNCMGLSLLGMYRYTLFLRCLELKQTPIETSLTCAAKPFVWFRLIGNIWPPLMLILISFDRLFITCMPLLYNRWLKGKGIYTCIFSIIFVTVFCLIGAALGIKHREEPVKFDCGRKATYSVTFATIIYYFETLGYGAAFVINFVAYIRARSIFTSEVMREQLKRTRVFLAVNILSVLLVITPNLKSLSIHMLRYIGMSENLFLMVNIASLINSSFNIFIYIALYQSFRTELVYALGRLPFTIQQQGVSALSRSLHALKENIHFLKEKEVKNNRTIRKNMTRTTRKINKLHGYEVPVRKRDISALVLFFKRYKIALAKTRAVIMNDDIETDDLQKNG